MFTVECLIDCRGGSVFVWFQLHSFTKQKLTSLWEQNKQTGGQKNVPFMRLNYVYLQECPQRRTNYCSIHGAGQLRGWGEGISLLTSTEISSNLRVKNKIIAPYWIQLEDMQPATDKDLIQSVFSLSEPKWSTSGSKMGSHWYFKPNSASLPRLSPLDCIFIHKRPLFL